MDPAFWLERWQKQEIGFHQPFVHDLLQRFWPRLALARAATVFVPLCGKSLDMLWLAEQGHRVIGAELSALAIDEYFAERGFEPDCGTVGDFTVKSAGAYELWCGDFFELPREAVEDVAGVYDRASLIALPQDMQQRYAETLKRLLPASAPVLLVTLDYDQSLMQGPPFAAPRDQVRRLFAERYMITELASRSALERNPRFKQRGLTALEETVYLLRPA